MNAKYLEAVKTLLEADDTFVVVSVGWDDGEHLFPPFPKLMNCAWTGYLDDFLLHQVSEEDEHEPGFTTYLYRLSFETTEPTDPLGSYYEVSERVVLEHRPPGEMKVR